jgi:DNA-binding transcriptional ArsR family regulator
MNPMSEPKPTSELAQIESELKGKTLQIYWYMLRSPGSHVGVREIQRTLHLSSPSVASHHLEKLVSLGLVDKTRTGEYYITQEIKVGLLRFFTRLGRFLVPRYLFYSIWFTTMLIIYVTFYRHYGTIDNIVALMFGTLATVILWLETIRLWRQKPF